jgi:hypothetical protein
MERHGGHFATGAFDMTDDRRNGMIRGYGNAIVPQVAAVFVEAVMAG